MDETLVIRDLAIASALVNIISQPEGIFFGHATEELKYSHHPLPIDTLATVSGVVDGN